MTVRSLLIAGVFGMMALPLVRSTAQTPTQAAPAASTGAAQVATGGTRVHGTITDPDGELIPGATVTFTPAKGKGVVAKSGSDGAYTTTLTPGAFTFVVTMPGFASYSAINVKIPAVASTTLDAKLQVGVETQVVNVDSDAVQLSVDADANASSTIITGKDLDALSDDPDELSSELTALAGPSAGPNGGQIYVDGFTGGQLPPKSSIREIRINQNPFSAQYDKLGFGRIEVFTKPGTDKIHGSLQVNGNPSQFNSGNPLQAGTYVPPYHTVFAFGSVTGPLTKWASYSLGGSYRDIEDDAFTNATVYAASAGSTVVCAPGQPGCAQTQAQISTHTPQSRFEITPRFDLALGAKNVLTVRFQYEQNTATNQGIGNLTLPTAALNLTSNDGEIQISDTQTFSSRLINETRFEYERGRSTDTPLSTAAYVNVAGAFQNGGATAQRLSDHQDHFELQNYTSVALKKNFIRFGGRLRTTREAENTANNTNGSFQYAGLTYNGIGPDNSYATGSPSLFSITQVNNHKIGDTFADLGMYLETDWKARQNLTVSYGLRYETQNQIGDHHDIAPRVSFAYGIGKGTAPKTVLRGGFGMFYDRFQQSNILTLQAENGVNETVYTVNQPGAACRPGVANAIAACNAAATTQTTYTKTPNLRSPYIVQFALGGDRQLGKLGTMSVNYLHSQGVHELASQNIGYNFVNPTASTANYQYFSEGTFHQDQLIVNARVQAGRKVSLFGFYSLGSVKGDSSGAGSFLSTPGNIAADYGRTAFDVRSRFFMAGSVTLPHFIQFSPFVLGQSGNPFNVTLGSDANNDTLYNDRPLLANGLAANGTTIKTLAGCGTFATRTAPGSGGLAVAPINACTGPALFSFNFRLTKTFGFGGLRNAIPAGSGQGGPGGGGPPPGGRGGGRGGPGGPSFGGGGGASTGKRYNLAVGLNVQNLFNNENLASPIATLSSPQFAQSTQLTGGAYTTNSALRRISLQASFTF